jgi:hypothetical protein
MPASSQVLLVGTSFKRFSPLSIGFILVWVSGSKSNKFSRVLWISNGVVNLINGKLANLSQCENLSLSEVKYASRSVTSDKVLSFNRKQSDVNNLLVVYYRNTNIVSSLCFAITKFLDIRCVNAVWLCAISINTCISMRKPLFIRGQIRLSISDLW